MAAAKDAGAPLKAAQAAANAARTEPVIVCEFRLQYHSEVAASIWRHHDPLDARPVYFFAACERWSESRGYRDFDRAAAAIQREYKGEKWRLQAFPGGQTHKTLNDAREKKAKDALARAAAHEQKTARAAQRRRK